MSTVKELMPSPAGTVAEPPAADDDEEDVAGADEDDDEEEEGDEDDEQPAAIRAATAARATQPSRGRGLPWPCERECPPPCLLLPSSIPYPFRGTPG